MSSTAADLRSTYEALNERMLAGRPHLAAKVTAAREAAEAAERLEGASVEQILEPALETYGAELRAHGHDFAGWPERRCLCGWTPKRQSRDAGRAVGLHVSAAHKRASKAYDLESERLLAAHPIAGAPSPF